MPGAFVGQVASETRPAKCLENILPANITYLGDAIEESKGLGLLYFRGDSHPNWLGSYLIYRKIINTVIERGVDIAPPVELRALTARMAGYDGDLVTGMAPEQKPAWEAENSWSKGAYTYELTICFESDPQTSKARVVQDPYYENYVGTRKLVVMEQDDKSLPKCIVFRDSTCQFMMGFIAEHFSKTVFVWHQGDMIDEFIEHEKPDCVLQIMAERFVWTYPQRKPWISIGYDG